MSFQRVAVEWAAWFTFAAVLTAPAWVRGDLLGHPDVDVWNHAWGLWWWADSLANGQFPWHTALLSHPRGGVLWFADPLGALAMLPVTWTLGPAVAWNLLLIARIAWAGFHARRFAGVLGTPGPHTVLAGVAFAASPYLLCEVYNGISEVCAVGWVPLVLAQALIFARERSLRSALLAGGAWGLSFWATPYYGLASGLVLGPAFVIWAVSAIREGRARGPAPTPGVGGAPRSEPTRGGGPPWPPLLAGITLAAVLGGAAILTWRAALNAEGAVIQRSELSEASLARHNAVDIRELVWPGAFASVDYEAEYGGEKFRHTLYLRLSVLALALFAVARRPRALAPWLGLAAIAAIFGLGTRLLYDGRYPMGNHGGLLPFGFLVAWIPGIAITHPARLAIAAHAILGALAADALRDFGRRSLVVIPIVLGETLGFSLAAWPLPGSPSPISEIYRTIATSTDPRGVLDLPPQVRRTMATSVYFWYQTVHHHPIPWWPNVRADENGDVATMKAFLPPRASVGVRPRFAPLGGDIVAHLRATYGWIVVHTELDTLTQGAGESTRILTEAFGEPVVEGSERMWTIEGP